jgi:hypothetical protein
MRYLPDVRVACACRQTDRRSTFATATTVLSREE